MGFASLNPSYAYCRTGNSLSALGAERECMRWCASSAGRRISRSAEEVAAADENDNEQSEKERKRHRSDARLPRHRICRHPDQHRYVYRQDRYPEPQRQDHERVTAAPELGRSPYPGAKNAPLPSPSCDQAWDQTNEESQDGRQEPIVNQRCNIGNSGETSECRQ